MTVSILVPVYNAAEYLKKCVGSITGQTYTDLQIVLINDGSTDGSWKIMRELASQDNRIEIYTQANQGVAATRNHLLEKVKGDFVLFVDSDDWIDPVTIETLMHEQQKGDYDIVMYQLHGNNGGSVVVYTQEEAIQLFLEHGFFRGMLWNKLIRSTLFEGLELDETISYGEDSFLTWNILQRIKNVVVLKKNFYHYNRNESGLSHQLFNGKKFSSFMVWHNITSDTDEKWPQFSEDAHARSACEMAQILLAAAINGYKPDEQTRMLQHSIRQDWHLMKKKNVSTMTMRAFAWLVSRCYGLVLFLSPVLGPYYRKRYGLD